MEGEQHLPEEKKLGTLLKIVTIFLVLLIIVFAAVMLVQRLPGKFTEVKIIEDSISYNDSMMQFSFSIYNAEGKDLSYECALYDSHPLEDGLLNREMQSIFSRNAFVEAGQELVFQNSVELSQKPQKLFLLINSPQTEPQVLSLIVP